MLVDFGGSLIRRWIKQEGGGVAIAFGLSALLLTGIAGAAVDLTVFANEKVRLQNAADQSAINAARRMRIVRGDEESLVALAEDGARRALISQGLDPSTVRAAAKVDLEKHSVSIAVDTVVPGFFSKLLGIEGFRATALASARLSGSAPVCLIGINERERRTIHLEKSAALKANGCAVFSNSTHREGLRIDNHARIEAALICSSGGRFGPRAAFSPDARTDCPSAGDPLRDIHPPAVGSCTHHDLVVTSDARLLPGVYCGGLRVEKGARVTLAEGLYVIKDGPLRVDRGALSGRHTGFFFTGEKAVFDFRSDATIDLTAAREGPLAGILFFEDRAAPIGRNFTIASNDARNLLGTIYLPRGDFRVTAKERVADRSAFTVIVANTLRLSEGPLLTLNSDYAATDIPVPDGVGPNGDVILSQ